MKIRKLEWAVAFVIAIPLIYGIQHLPRLDVDPMVKLATYSETDKELCVMLAENIQGRKQYILSQRLPANLYDHYERYENMEQMFKWHVLYCGDG